MSIGVLRSFWMEHATRSLPFWLLGVVAAAAVGTSLVATAADDNYEMIEFALVSALAVAFILQSIGLLYNGGFAESLSCRPPDATLRLPVSSAMIVFARYTFNLLAIASSTIVLYALIASVAELPYSNPWEIVAVMLALISLLQFVALATARLGDWAIAFVAGSAIAYLVIRTFLVYDTRFNSLFALDLAVTAAALPLTWVALVVIRHDIGTIPALPGDRWLSLINIRQRERPPFRSARHAQLWFDTVRYWNPFSRVFVVLAGLAAIAHLSFAFVPGFQDDSTLAESLITCAIASSIVSGAVVAVQNRRMMLGSMANFLYLRPLSTAQLADARLVAALRVVLVPTVALTTASGLYSAITTDQDWSLSESFIRNVPYLLTSIAGVWLAYWTWNIIGIFLIYALVFLPSLLPFDAMRTSDAYPKAASVVIVIVFALSYASVLIRRRISWKIGIGLPLGVAAAIFVHLAALRYVFGENSLDRNSFTFGIFVELAGILLCMLAPIVSVPLALKWTRHR